MNSYASFFVILANICKKYVKEKFCNNFFAEKVLTQII